MNRLAPVAFAAGLLLAGGSAWAGGPGSAHYGRGTANTFWFMHIADSHIGATPIEGPNASEHLEVALNDAVEVIQPAFVVNTGDVCDGSLGLIPASGQSQQEWDEYAAIFTGAGMTPDFYFDLPGNHDGYGDEGMTFYLANSLLGQTHDRLYTWWSVDMPKGEYFFFGLNSAGDGSPPFVEDPEITDDELDALESALDEHAAAELIFTLGHHRLDEPDGGAALVDLLQAHEVGYYLHGHKHDYEEYLEDEGTVVVNEVDSLGKANHENLAVGVIDHNALSYRATDVVDPWPLVIISAPVSASLRDHPDEAHPYAYEVCKDRPDNPVRALIFSDEPPAQVTVDIGGVVQGELSLVSPWTALWQAELDTSSLGDGPHEITVTAVVGNSIVQDWVTTNFVVGPCDPLPDEGDPAAGGGGSGSGAAGGSAGSAGSGGFTGQGGGAASGGAAGGADLDEGILPLDDAGACSCRIGGPAPADGGGTRTWWAWLALAALARKRRTACGAR